MTPADPRGAWLAGVRGMSVVRDVGALELAGLGVGAGAEFHGLLAGAVALEADAGPGLPLGVAVDTDPGQGGGVPVVGVDATIVFSGAVTSMSLSTTVRWYCVLQLPQERTSVPEFWTWKPVTVSLPASLNWSTLSASFRTLPLVTW